MAAITPSTNLILLKNNNNLSDQNQLTFQTKQAQESFFLSLPKLEVDNFTYQRKDYVIRYNACIDDILDYNYCMYQNEAYSDRWFYAYIVNMRYVNDNVTEITIKTDVFQTFQFDIIYKTCFVEREHVSNDTIGLHTIPEGLETGEYVCDSIQSLYYPGNTCYICIGVSDLTAEVSADVNTDIRQFGGIYSGINYLVCETPLAASKTLEAWDAAGKGDAVVSVFMIPTALTGTLTFKTYSTSGVTYNLAIPPYTADYTELNRVTNIPMPTTINGYTPHNNKLFVYPYNYFFVTNNVGMDIDFHYEDFVNNAPIFRTVGVITPGCSIKCYPENYKKITDVSNSGYSYNYGISGAKYPICSWETDVYTNWLTQNGVNIGGIQLNAAQAGYIGGAASAALGIGSLLAGNIFGIAQAGAGIGDILTTMKSNYQHSLIPDSAKGNANSGDITFSNSRMDIPLNKMTIKSEYARVIDGYFDMYGYKVNSLKIPDIFSRRYWNYVKCINATMDGLIPEYYLNEIRNLFNNGITLWHDPNEFMDYSNSNIIVNP